MLERSRRKGMNRKNFLKSTSSVTIGGTLRGLGKAAAQISTASNPVPDRSPNIIFILVDEPRQDLSELVLKERRQEEWRGNQAAAEQRVVSFEPGRPIVRYLLSCETVPSFGPRV